jgi:hypothetical protein
VVTPSCSVLFLQKNNISKIQCTIIYDNSLFAYEVIGMQNEDEAEGKMIKEVR